MSIKEVKINYVTDVATSLFMQKSINDVTIDEIAEAAGIGVASVYRYFTNKQNIVKSAVFKMQKNVFQHFYGASNEKTGYDKINKFYNTIVDIFIKHPEYFSFMEKLDYFQGNQDNNLFYADEYEKIKVLFISFYKEGLNDNTIKMVDNINLFYQSSMNGAICLAKKLTLRKDDSNVEMLQELINIIVSSLKK